MQPHKSEHWLFPKIKGWGASVARVALACQLILESAKQESPGRHLLSVDERTSIQALQRAEGVAPDSNTDSYR